MLRSVAGVELGSAPGGGPDTAIPWAFTDRPAYPLESPMPDRKVTATDKTSEQAQRATDATVDERATHPADTDVIVEPVVDDSHEDLVRRVAKLERFLL